MKIQTEKEECGCRGNLRCLGKTAKF